MHINMNFCLAMRLAYQAGCFHSCLSGLVHDDFQETGGYDAAFAQQRMSLLVGTPPVNLHMLGRIITNNMHVK